MLSASITSASRIIGVPASGPVRRAADSLLRDIRHTCLPGSSGGIDILLCSGKLKAEQYVLRLEMEELRLYASDDLGFVYGLYAVSQEILGVHPFWFWNDQQFGRRTAYEIPQRWEKRSVPNKVRYRGWFINDEVLLDAWYLHGSKDGPWEMAFEALLRLGGNLVIPGTDKNAHRYSELASSFGLYITHHHAEPLGAAMFRRAYPHLTPSYAEHPDLFEELWLKGIETQKNRRVVWNLGFRGQGDQPFWEDAPQYSTPQSRGALISSLIRKQYDMVQAAQPGAPCCTNLYGEVMELYNDGLIDLPDGVIRIWADNGYGKMVTRRQNNHNPRIRALPQEGLDAAHGVYYHASFYDLQAASQMTMLPNPPDFVRRELKEAMAMGLTDYWIVNCSNIKPHVYTLDYIAALWRDGDADPTQHLLDYCARYYGEANAEPVAECFKRYYACAPHFGAHEDERAGEQFGNHCTRMLVSQWMKDADHPAEGMRWAVDVPTLEAQVLWYKGKCEEAACGYAALLGVCEHTRVRLAGAGKTLFEDSIMMQVKLLFHTYEGAWLAMESLLSAMRREWLNAFYLAGKSKSMFASADRAMREREHGQWHLFYANDCQADVKQSAWMMGLLMGAVRNIGDGPHFYHWQRLFTDAPEDAGIMLLLNTKNHMDNDELFACMQARWQELMNRDVSVSDREDMQKGK